VKIHVEQPDGSDVILAIRGPGEVLGEMSILDSLGRSANAETMEDCDLCWLDRVTFKNYLQSTPIMAYNLACILARRLRIASVQIQALSSMDVYGRVSRQLLAFANEFGEPAANGDVRIPLRLTQPDLASLVGASRVRVNQVLVFYKRHKYLTVDHEHRITIHNAAALAKRC
jgi:CRP/FNR family cyclic AMP-dependent transcriptional regulator